MKVKFVDCMIMFHLLNHIITSNDKYSLSDELKIKITKYKYLFYSYVIDFEVFKNELTQFVFNKYDYNKLMQENNKDNIDNYSFSILLDFHEARINKLCSLIEIPTDKIEKFTFEEFSEILKLNINNTDLYIAYIFGEPINSETFIQLINIYLTDF